MLAQLAVLLALSAIEPERPLITTSMPAFLGVAFGLTEDEGVVITEVRTNTAAERAGLAPGDVVLTFAGVTIREAEDLRKAVVSRRAGDKVEMRIRRDGTDKDLKVTLGRPPLPEEMLTQREPPRVAGGTIEGALTFTGDVHSSGNLVVTGAMQVEGNVRLGFSGVLDIPVNDRTTQPALHVGGEVELSGMLYVAKSNLDFKAGDSFEIVRGARSIKGGFNTLWLPTLPAGLTWKVEIDNVARGQDRNKDGKNDVTLVVVKK